MLLHASNYSLCLYGQDIDRVALMMCQINGALYAAGCRSHYPLPCWAPPTEPAEPLAAGPRNRHVPERSKEQRAALLPFDQV